MHLVKLLTLLLSLLLIFGCDSANTPSAENVQKTATLSNSDSSCIVDDKWLNTTDYDHKVDYSNKHIETDFFLLVYSNSPNFCAYMQRKNKLNSVPFQCNSPNEFGWVIHGLWGESKTAYVNGNIKKHPRFCEGNLQPLAIDMMKPYLCMSPGTKLLQGQWEKHGACDFASANDYFAKTQELAQRFKFPPKTLKAKQAMFWMKENNPSLNDKWLHFSGYEFGICFGKNFELMSCPRKQN